MKALGIFLLLFGFKLGAQTPVLNYCDSTNWAKEGTYVLIKTRPSEVVSISKDFISTDGLCYIESKRMVNDTVIVFIESYKVIIYPKP